MQINDIVQILELEAAPCYQESYDNTGLLTGLPNWECTGIVCTLDATEAVVLEAVKSGCNLIVAHHPIIFVGLKKINGENYIEKAIIAAIKNDIAIYAIHTNLDNMIGGVNKIIADKLGLANQKILLPKAQTLLKLYVYVPVEAAETVRNAIFAAGGGAIGGYSEVSFNQTGTGTFTAGKHTNPFVGEPDIRHHEPEVKIEIIVPVHLQSKIIAAMLASHPYEEVAYGMLTLGGSNQQIGSGIVGELQNYTSENEVLNMIKDRFGLSVIRHTTLLGKPLKKIALCGGAGSFLIKRAIAAGAHLYISADIKYHEFFDADEKILVADIGHWESEQFTIDLLYDVLAAKFPTFAVRKTKVKTNPVHYFI